MKFSTRFFAGILTVIASNAVQAGPTQTNSSHLLASIVKRSLHNSPEILAARSAVEAARTRLGGAALPLNNPEIDAEAERTDINTYQIGISQTIDWHDKRSALEQVAQAQLLTAQQQLAALRLSKAAELLDAIGRIATQTAVNRLSRHRSEIMARFSKLAKQRHAAGDISRSELELARLSQAEADMQYARTQAEFIQANSDFYSISGRMLTESVELPESLSIDFSSRSNDEAIARQHPRVQAALLSAQIAKRQINAADRDRRPDPTVGISAGREDDNNLLALRFSMPLQIRNSYQSNVDAARQDALQAEQLAQQIYWELRAQLESAEQRYTVISNAWKTWLSQGRSSLQKRIELLETLWRAGEISTTDYLLQVQQTLDTQIARIELHGDLWNAWLAWMNYSASLGNWLNTKN
jgi:cobalt-zinc-cadmium efflux system outer membrane protein